MAGSSVKVTMNGFDEFITAVGKSSAVEVLLDAVANETAQTAKRSAPYSTITDPNHVHYRDSIHVETVEAKHRTVKRVVASVPHAMAVEARRGVLSRALGEAKRQWS